MPPMHYKFGLAYAAAAFDGWVKQNGPMCAAASLVGAWNTVMRAKRGDATALTRDDGVGALRTLIEQIIERKRNSFERVVIAQRKL